MSPVACEGGRFLIPRSPLDCPFFAPALVISINLGNRRRVDDTHEADIVGLKKGDCELRSHCIQAYRAVILTALFSFLTGCAGIPRGIVPVKGFEVARYTGNWWEIARLDHRFERGLSNVSATYTLKPDGAGRIVVFNQGFKDETGEWTDVTGKAYITGEPGEGRLKVSFFGPFYAAYNVIHLDPEYRHAIVCSSNMSYLWILSRTRTLDETTLASLVDRAKGLGFKTEDLLYVRHDRARPE